MDETASTPRWRYLLWLFGYINLFIWAGYALALSYVPFGDWFDSARGLDPRFVWQTGVFVAGVVISFATLRHAARGLHTSPGSNRTAGRARSPSR